MTTTAPIAEVNNIVNVLTNCSRMCRRLSSSAELNEGADLTLPDIPKLIRMVNDCAASCDIAVMLLERKSHIAVDFLHICEEIALECAWQCSKYGLGLCKKCSEVCEQVAKVCLRHIS